MDTFRKTKLFPCTKRIVFFFIIQSIFIYSIFIRDLKASQLLKEEEIPKSEYNGYQYPKRIENIRVQEHVSLGGSTIEHTRQIIEQADQFTIAFMYRFNSPVLTRILSDKYFSLKQQETKFIPLIFLDYQSYINKSSGSYKSYVRHLTRKVPTTFVDLGQSGTKFHHKIIICKKKKERAFTIVGSANSTFEADNQHSEDISIIQSNKLAQILLEQFSQLLKNSKGTHQTKLYDALKIDSKKSNLEYLNEFLNVIEKDTLAHANSNFGYRASIESLGISSGYNDESCFEVVKKNVLNNPDNNAVIFFENYFNLESFKSVRKFLKKPPPKFIVVYPAKLQPRKEGSRDNAKKYRESLEKLLENSSNSDNYSMITFKPYTGYIFHHKLIIQYLTEGDPIVYTGSFHFSTTATEKNSEIIIGIKSKDLAENYLSSILLNSDLGSKIKVWEYLQKNSLPLQGKNNKIILASKKLNISIENDIQKYLSSLNTIILRLLDSLGYDYQGRTEINLVIDNMLNSIDEQAQYMEKNRLTTVIKQQIESYEEESVGIFIRQKVNDLLGNLKVESIEPKQGFKSWLNDFSQTIDEVKTRSEEDIKKLNVDIKSLKRKSEGREKTLEKDKENKRLKPKTVQKKKSELKEIKSKLNELEEKYDSIKDTLYELDNIRQALSDFCKFRSRSKEIFDLKILLDAIQESYVHEIEVSDKEISLEEEASPVY